MQPLLPWPDPMPKTPKKPKPPASKKRDKPAQPTHPAVPVDRDGPDGRPRDMTKPPPELSPVPEGAVD